ncbi:NAD(P)/FAD-dependent oxidoreductase [Synechococcus sp. MIT S9508]|uniref:NAD(P)/FAD-dependent oxidoreductase n=1 Tax=Synechococcus sp. MIT S9508 TaxID=1801629 RepID=UPI0007BB8F0B|nr:FAD-dependent oxidoreductase [Synechococcus sp. MIT S9508]KZR90596.1 L-2-hydroxyglutarate oxidase LhgO [Synechococcus sp. MIT S9508]
MTRHSCDVLIVGGGMVGLCIAYQLLERRVTTNIIVLDKEPDLGRHSSGRNSGVLHAGLYYKPDSVKAQVCVSGANRLKAWVNERKLPLNACGKLIVPQRAELDGQLDVLAERGRANGAVVELWDESQLRQKMPEARSASGRALWSPNTAVVKPISVVQRLQQELRQRGVNVLAAQSGWTAKPEQLQLLLADGSAVQYGHLFNCAGLQADRVAHSFGVGEEYSLLPFKGLYWQLKANCPIVPSCNLYPVPDLNVPFLGVHFTPSAGASPVVSIGPTATPAWGRENYRRLQAAEPAMAVANLALLARQYLVNRGGFRRYVHEQAFLSLPPLLLRAAQQLIPAIRAEHLELSDKVGIRSQLFNHNTQAMEDDFLCLPGLSSTHVLNAISPAFTASFALADLILDQVMDDFNFS